MAPLIPVLAVLALAVGLVGAGYRLSALVSIRRRSLVTGPFLSGDLAAEFAVSRFHARWYAVTLLFLAFDMETVFMYPWAIVAVDIGAEAVVEMFVFLALLLVGVLYVPDRLSTPRRLHSAAPAGTDRARRDRGAARRRALRRPARMATGLLALFTASLSAGFAAAAAGRSVAATELGTPLREAAPTFVEYLCDPSDLGALWSYPGRLSFPATATATGGIERASFIEAGIQAGSRWIRDYSGRFYRT